jgi:homoserine O-acetyltransferase/O-succinyltransferase
MTVGSSHNSTSLPTSSAKSIEGIEPKVAVIGDYCFENGQMLSTLQVAYETYGNLNRSGSNVILIAHGYAGNQHAAGYYVPGTSSPCTGAGEPGWWDSLIGPGKAINTDRFFVVSSNTLGSSYGTTGPASINPKTGKPYGPDFPEITIVDMVRVQHALLTQLGVKRVLAVVGYSYGGYQAFQWAVTYPDMLNGIVVASSSPKGSRNPQTVQDLIARLSRHPNWNNGWYYDHGGIKSTLVNFRLEMLKSYGFNHEQNDESSITRHLAESWADVFDAHSLVVLRRAAEYRDAEKDYELINAKVLYVLCKSDKLFPPTIATGVMAKLNAHDVDSEYFELDSDKGHVGVLHDSPKWEHALRSFLARLQNSRGL